MAIQFSTILLMDFLIAIPIILYYYHYGVAHPQKRGVLTAAFREHIRNAYALTGIAVVLIPTLLVFYLWDNLLKLYPRLFFQTAAVMVILVLIFEYVNYYSYVHYEGTRF